MTTTWQSRWKCPTCGQFGPLRPYEGTDTIVTCDACPPLLIGSLKPPMEPDLTVTGTTEECEELIPSHLCDDYDGATVERAFIRLMSGDVTKTRYGWRVSLRHDLDDHRGEAKAYWPEQNACCLCWSRKSRGYCSHELAVKLAKELLQRRMTERTQMAEAKLDGLHGRGCDEPYR